ncbi:MAG: hypothetical protein KatS3mg108_1676 [Isosphaeraceae bacterium]|nr:MAG: hypothetical protein KatS3mg108_1676 [Isosphaeraceae bacterium]
MAHLFEFDPSEVLGIPADARLEQVREAYRAQSKKHHPDAGGDVWAFRLVHLAYEILCRSRVASRLREEEQSRPTPPRSAATQSTDAHTTTAPPLNEEEVCRTVIDPGYPDLRLVRAELLILRHEIDGLIDLMTSTAAQRNLSCTLHLAGPIGDPATAQGRSEHHAVQTIREAVRKLIRETRPEAHRILLEGPRCAAWLRYQSAREAYHSARRFRTLLHANGYGLALTTRELVVPRN